MQQQPIERDWIDAEPGWHAMGAELRRLMRRNRAHPTPLLVVVLLLTAVGIWRGYVYQPTYRARIAMRLIESNAGLDLAPHPAHELRAWVMDVALADYNLKSVIERFDLYPKYRRAGAMDLALSSMREDIDVEVWRNEFLLEDDSEVGRSARVAISYLHKDPDIAYQVVEALVQEAIDAQARARRSQVALVAQSLEPVIASAREELVELKVRRMGIRGRSSDSSDSLELSKERLANPQNRKTVPKKPDDKEIEDAERRIADLLREQRDAQLRQDAEAQNLAFRTEIIDTERPRAQNLRGATVALGGGLGLVIGLLFGGVLIQAFDRRIYTEEDLRRLGYSVCGALPPFPGDGVGSMNTRVRMRAK